MLVILSNNFFITIHNIPKFNDVIASTITIINNNTINDNRYRHDVFYKWNRSRLDIFMDKI